MLHEKHHEILVAAMENIYFFIHLSAAILGCSTLGRGSRF